MENQMDFASRIGARGIVASTLVTLSLTVLLFSFLIGLGLWDLKLAVKLEELPKIGSLFWSLASLAWFVSVFVGGFMSASVTRSNLTRDGVFNALTTWSAAYLAFAAAMIYYTPDFVRTMIDQSTTGQFFLAFVGDAISLGICVYGGVLGVKFENSSLKSTLETRGQKPFKPAHA